MEQGRTIVIAFYYSLAIGFSLTFIGTYYFQPLFPLKLDSLEWCKMWLGTTVVDYHVIAICMSAITIGTEGWKYGGLWALGLNIIGSPIACFYVIYKLQKGSSLEIS